MLRRLSLLLPLVFALSLILHDRQPAFACCPSGAMDRAVINSNQTIVILWDAQKKIEHFIRKASFVTDGEEFGFIVPSPTQPELSESGNDAFPALADLTAPAIEYRTRHLPSDTKWASLSGASPAPAGGVDAPPLPPPEVRVLEKKRVAGFDATVLEADTVDVLAEWLKKNDYAFSPAVAEWVKPYVEKKWKLTALKVVKEMGNPLPQQINAPALRMSFATDTPLFPYREPDAAAAIQQLRSLTQATRTLRVFFIGEARYAGELTKTQAWTGKAAWSNKLAEADRKQVLEKLNLPLDSGPAEFWLTEFEDPWPYAKAPSDLTFVKASQQETLKRPPIIEYNDVYDLPPGSEPTEEITGTRKYVPSRQSNEWRESRDVQTNNEPGQNAGLWRAFGLAMAAVGLAGAAVIVVLLIRKR